jgi:hypothetical protein
MKHIGIGIVSLLGVWLMTIGHSSLEKKPVVRQGIAGEQPGFAVIELFTSEGCSSCPPADELANELANEAQKHNQPIYVLSFHVDYWNRLGWKDPFSMHAATERQYWYAKLFPKSNVYTPQMVVNGTAEFVGSRKAEAQQHVEAGLRESPTEPLTLSLLSVEPGKALEIAYAFPKTEDNLVLHCALVEKGLSSEVRAGENKGKKLVHENVVRYFQSVEIPAAKGTLTIAQELHKGHFEVIAYLQNTRTGKIVGANKLSL